ncbi:MAG: Uncharacterized protein AUK63_891 [bacterium P3]|nr:MAG: carbon starvation protein A [bacterium P201]KWW30445.1 MAG: Uncharacterized protein AUK63_891 [bacterium P3]KWW41332.1 MAG: Uncharacterized protein F083_1079 [bacterium F083]
MITFIVSIVLLIAAYWLYSKFIDRMLGTDPGRKTPAVEHPDGVDYVPMKPWRIYLIQFLNIAGVGPIVGAIMGARFGTSSYLWIVLGTIFAGAVHDFIGGFISLRKNGSSLPEIHGHYLGNGVKVFMRIFTVVLMILVGAVFVSTPATLINNSFTPTWNIYLWVGVIFAYYLIATLLPIDKVIGKIYPVFGMLLLAMAVAIVVAFVIHGVPIPELWDQFANQHPQKESTPIFPMMFISIACGAISGFHATQSPLMARCMTNERQARPIFYGAMVTEGVVALIWAAAGAYFFHNKAALCEGVSGNGMVGVIANEWFTPVIATICILGVISAAVTTGDTALRSARLIVAEFMHVDQRPIGKRLVVATPIFLCSAALLVYSLSNQQGFDIIWRYFSWSNQLLATFTLWAVTVYLYWKQKPYIITLLPALFMTMVTGCFLFVAEKEGLGAYLPRPVGYAAGGLITLLALARFFQWTHPRDKMIERHRQRTKHLSFEEAAKKRGIDTINE